MIELLNNTLVLNVIDKRLRRDYLILVIPCYLMRVRTKHSIIKSFNCILIGIVNAINHGWINCALLHEISNIS